MARRIISYTLIVLLAGSVIYIGWIFFSKFNEKQARALDAVPNDAAVIFEMRDVVSLWNKLNQTNLIWPDINKYEPFSLIAEVGKRIEKSAKKNTEIASLLNKNPFVISLHQAGGGLNFFACVSKVESEDDMKTFLEEISGSTLSSGREYEGSSLYSFTAGKFKLFAAWHSGVLMFSDSESLLEAGLARLQQEKKFDDDIVFKKLNHTVSKNVDANIYVHHKFFPGVLQALGDKDIMDLVLSNGLYAQMTELDMNIGPNSISMSGFSSAADSTSSMLTIFKRQEPQHFTITRFVPERIRHMLFMGISDADKYFEDRESWLKKNNKLDDFREDLNAFNRDHDCNLKQHILSWMGNEIVTFTATYDSLNAENRFIVIRRNETGNPKEELTRLAQKLDTVSSSILIAEGVEIRQLRAKNIFSILLGQAFGNIDNPYFIEIENNVVFCNSPTALQKYFVDLVNDKVLARNVTFVNYVNENLSDKANLFYYSSSGKIMEILNGILNDKSKAQLEKNQVLWSKFDAFSWQLSKAEGMFYNTMHIRYNPSQKSEEKTFWELALDTTLSMKPQLIINHNTGARDIFVQDDEFTIYLISNTGKLLWKKQMEEKIIGDVKQVDMLNNGKLQIAFCTESQLHIIDIKGNYLDRFPVNLNSSATSQFAVFDYESDKNYRFFIPTKNKLMVIDKEGKTVTGWSFEGASSDIVQPAEFHRINNKDYIFTVDISGKVYMLDRKGKIRFEVKQSLSDRSGSNIYFEAGKEIENCNVTYSDSLGKIHRLYFNGRTDSLTLRNLSPNHHFAMVDANGDGIKDILLHEDDKITIHTWNKKLLFTHEFNRNIIEPPMAFVLKDRSIRIGALNKDENLVYIIDENGSLNDKFPVSGSTIFMMEDINNDTYPEIVVGNLFGKIYSYTVK